MAQKYITIKTSDLSGADLPDGEGETLAFAVGKSSYTIDLTDDELGAFYDLLKPYVDAARKADSSTPTPRARAAAAPKQDLAAVREWANAGGFSVSSRGRVPSNVLEAYAAAH